MTCVAKRRYTTKAKRKEILKELGLSEAEMTKHWEEAVKVNSKCELIASSGLDWTDLTEWQIREIPNLAERTIQQLKEKEQAEENKRLADEERERQRQHYNENFEDIMIEKIDKHEELTESEIERLVDEYEISREKGENGRRTRPVNSIIELKGKTFCVAWQQGLIESQPDSYIEQPYEVEKHEYEKVITVTEWKRKEENRVNSYKEEYKENEKVETSVLTFILTLVVGLGMTALSIDLHLKELAVIGIAVLIVGSLISLIIGKAEEKTKKMSSENILIDFLNK